MLCEIYKGNKKAEMYLYVPLEKGLKDVPEHYCKVLVTRTVMKLS